MAWKAARWPLGRFVTFAGLIAVWTTACSTPTSPTPVTTLKSIVYERVYPADPNYVSPIPALADGKLAMNIQIPQPDDPRRRSQGRLCVLEPDSHGPSFACPPLTLSVLDVPLNHDVSVEIDDQALTDRGIKSVATRLYVNGILITRVDRYSNGGEVGRFNIDARGNIR